MNRQKEAKLKRDAEIETIDKNGLKECIICNERRDLTFFAKHSTSIDGYKYECTICTGYKVTENKIDITKEKKCSKCHEIKSVEEYSNSNGRYHQYCKPCNKLVCAEYRQKNKNKITEIPKEIISKVCNSCKIDKEFIFFGKNVACKFGYEGQCKDCVNTRRREQRKNKK
jgi:hypothetical protein